MKPVNRMSIAELRRLQPSLPLATEPLGPPPPSTAKQRNRALGRLPAGQMNKTEARYAEHLKALEARGEVLWWKFEAMKFRLADNTFYSPDFSVMMADCTLQQHEIKGFWEDDARVKIKVAASLYPFLFVALKPLPKKAGGGGGWSREEFGS